MLSKAGDRLTLMGAPYELSEMLGMELRAYFPKKITADRATEDGRHIFEIKRSGYGGASRPLFAFLLPDVEGISGTRVERGVICSRMGDVEGRFGSWSIR